MIIVVPLQLIILALEPVRLWFDFPNDKDTLRISDAKFVQVIHTSNIGMPFELGDADYWPNGGFAEQPGCKDGTGED